MTATGTAPAADLAHRVRRLEDLAAIRRLVADYRRHLDARDRQAYSELFARDGEWAGVLGRAHGPEEIRELLERNLPDNPPAPGKTSWHVITDPAIEIDGDRATGELTWALIARGADDRPNLEMLGHYRDEYVREDGRWRFFRRNSWLDMPPTESAAG